MKYLIFSSLIYVLFVSSLMARELGEDESNVECTNSIHKSRPHMALVKVEVKDEDEIPEVKEVETKTRSK